MPKHKSTEPVLDKLTKCLELTASPHDGEALAAIRKANLIRENLKLMWSDLITPSSTTPHATPRAPDNVADITEMFQRIWQYNPPSEKWLKILTSLNSFLLSRGYLTVKQMVIVKKFDDTARANMESNA